MTKYFLERSQRIPRRRDEVFAFFADASNLQEMTPPFLSFRILTTMPLTMRPGALMDYSLVLFGIRFRWRTRITRWQPGLCFVDEQAAGPYALWRHTHHFAEDGQGTLMRDEVEYALPLGPLGRLARWLFVQRTLDRIFDYRQDAIARRFAVATPAPARTAAGPASHGVALGAA
jgi:ligand-binding SRPBCC domain-containing protein